MWMDSVFTPASIEVVDGISVDNHPLICPSGYLDSSYHLLLIYPHRMPTLFSTVKESSFSSYWLVVNLI